MTKRDIRLSHPSVDSWLTQCEAAADQWAVEVNLPAMIHNLTHVNQLTPSAPADVRDKFIARQAEQIDAIVKQAFIEGMYRAVGEEPSR